MNNKTVIIFGVVIIVAIYFVYTSIINYTSTMNNEPILIPEIKVVLHLYKYQQKLKDQKMVNMV